MTTPKLKTWKPEFKRGKNFSMLILASRGSGKSYLCRYLLEYHLRDKFDSFIVFSDSEDELENYREILPGRLFFDDFYPEMVEAVVKKNKERQQIGKPLFQTLVLFDDKISNKMRYDDQILQLFTRGRHVGISIIFISQSHVFANTTWRNNSDTIIILKQNARQAREAINDNILIGSLDAPEDANEKKYFMNIMRHYINKEGDALVLDFNKGAFDNLYQYRAPQVKKQPIAAEALRILPKGKPKPEEIEKLEEKLFNPPDPDASESSESSEDSESSSLDLAFSFL